MTTAPDIITQIQTVLQADPALQAQLKSCTDADSAATLIVKAAANQGIALSKSDLVAGAKASQSAAIPDHELDLVAGGSIPAWQQENEDRARRIAEADRRADDAMWARIKSLLPLKFR